MLVQHSGNVIKELQFDARLTQTGHDPQSWQFKEFYDAAGLGVELVWPCERYEIGKDEPPTDIKFEQISHQLFAITFDAHVAVKEQCSLFLFPHHSAFINMTEPRSQYPWPIPQVIEADWWPGHLRVIFVNRPCLFEKHTPFAQGLVIPRREYTINQMKPTEITERENALQFVKTNQDQYITRRINHEGFATQDNLYERLSHLHKSDSLPREVRKTINQPKIRLSWK